jgi:hypothetical protein
MHRPVGNTATGRDIEETTQREETLHTWSLNVSNDASGRIVHELDADLGDASAGT